MAYDAEMGAPILPATLLMVAMWPKPCEVITGRTALVSETVPGVCMCMSKKRI